MQSQTTDDEKTIDSWLQNHQVHFPNLNINKSSVTVQQDRTIWDNKDIPQNIHHSSVEFLSNPALVINYNYNYPVPKEKESLKISEIPSQYLTFNSTPESPIDLNEAEEIATSEPARLILPIENFNPVMDSRTPSSFDMRGENIVQHPELTYYTFEFESIEAPFDLITPVILSLYVFDANIGRRVSEQWSVVPDQWKSKLGEDPEFSYIINSPPKVSFALEKPRTTKSMDLTEQLFLVVVLDRPFILKGGAAVDDYYTNQKEANKKKAILATKEQCIGGWANTFAYGAIPMHTIMDTIATGIVRFDHVVATQQADEEYLQHKLNKVRKNPVNYSIDIRYKIAKQDPNDHSIPRIQEFFPLKPFFNLKYEEKLLIKLKTVVLNLKLGMKGRNIAAVINCFDGPTPINIINGRSSFKTRCQYHCTQPMFQEDIVLNLPYPITPTMNITFKFYHLPSKKKKGDIKLCAEGVYYIISKETGLIRPNGECKIPLKVDPKIQDVKDNSKSYLVVDLEMHSFLNSSHILMHEFLAGDTVNARAIQKLDEVIEFIPPIFDQIFKRIANNEKSSFEGLISFLRLFPIDQYDSRFVTLNKNQDEINLPDRTLSFYAKYAALRNVNVDSFFAAFVSSWIILTHEPATHERQDLISSPFLIEILLKCICMKHHFIFAPSLQELIFNLQKAIFAIYKLDPENQSIGLRLNHFLCLFYKDLIEFSDRGKVFFFIHYHLSLISEVRTNKYHQEIFIDFLSSFLTPKTLLFTLIPVRDNDPNTCFFTRDIAILIEEGLDTPKHNAIVFSILFNNLIRFNYTSIRLITPSLSCIISLFGRNREILQNNEQTKYRLIPFLIVLILISNYDLNKINDDFDQCCVYLLKSSNQHNLNNEGQYYSFSQNQCNYGYRNSFSLVESGPQSPDSPKMIADTNRFLLSFVWKKYSFMLQLILINFTTLSNSIQILNNIMIPFFDIQISNSLFSLIKFSITNYIQTNKTLIFTSPLSRIYKLIHYIMKNPSPHNIDLIDTLWNLENEIFNTNNRCIAFSLSGMKKYNLNESHIPFFEDSVIKPLLVEYGKLERELLSYDMNDPNNHETLADVYSSISEFFRPSPDAHVQVLLQLSEYHSKYGYYSEQVCSQLAAAANVAEHLNILGRIPNLFKDNVHPANSFKVACPTADLEICPESILNDLPNIPGFCTSKYFSQCGLIYLINSAMEACKRFHLYELSIRIHSLLRNLAETNHLWKVLEKHYQNGAFSWQVLEQFTTKSEREFGNYYRVEFQDNDTYIYRETSYANLWQVSEKLKDKAKIFSKGKPVIVLNDGEGLSSSKLDPTNYYVHVKAVEQYFTDDEKLKRITPFEQNYDVHRFYFDLPFSKTGQQTIENLELKRTIYTVSYPIPYIVSRVKVPPENIQKILFSPIEYSCESLQKQVDKITDATNNADFISLQPLIQGSLLTQVNEGPKRMAEVFLTGAEENQHTLNLRTIFRKFLKANEIAVSLHGEWVTKNPIFMTLQEELELGLNRLTSTLQPFLK